MQRLGKFEILAELGRGGFATVYRARDATLGREIALKALHPQLLADPEFGDRFLREARTLAGLRHPHIVTVYEAGEADGRVYIAMELAQGASLAHSIAERALRRSVCWRASAGRSTTPISAASFTATSSRPTHRSLRIAILLPRHRRHWVARTPAMAAGITDHCWTVEELLAFRVPLPRWTPPKRRGRPSRATKALIAQWCS
jgi:hypothetical protein